MFSDVEKVDLDFDTQKTFEIYGKNFVGSSNKGTEIIEIILLELDEYNKSINTEIIRIEAKDVEIIKF